MKGAGLPGLLPSPVQWMLPSKVVTTCGRIWPSWSWILASSSNTSTAPRTLGWACTFSIWPGTMVAEMMRIFASS